jgi:hypothetical protein
MPAQRGLKSGRTVNVSGEPMPTKQLYKCQYLSLGTWRKDGRIVDTPVWFAIADDQLLVFSSGEAGKVKRLRNSSRARVAPCTVSGKLLGEWQPALATLITDEAHIELAYQALRQRYGWKMLITDFFSRLAGKMSHRVFISIQLQPGDNVAQTAQSQ